MIQNLYQLPVYLLGGLTFLLLYLSAYGGFVSGRRRRRRRGPDNGKELSRGAVAGLVGVFALLLAFTLGFALARHQERRQAVVVEANAVMTAFLRADLLPPEERRAFRQAVRDYAATRDFAHASDLEGMVEASLAAQAKLWPLAVALTDGRLVGPERTFLLAAVNDVLDDHLVRAASGTQRLPLPVLALSVCLAAAALFLSAFSETAARFPAPAFIVQALSIAAVVTLILDFDNAGGGMIRTDDWIMSSTLAEMDRLLLREGGG
jgi:hypothetical protein